jgi:hypothetical protein
MGRVIHTETGARDRRQLLQGLGAALARAADPKCPAAEQGDILAFSALSLREINQAIEKTAAAWEGRGYWLKADKFRREWTWATQTGTALDASLQGNDLDRAALAAARMAPHLAGVRVPARLARSFPWRGALLRYKEIASRSPAS